MTELLIVRKCFSGPLYALEKGIKLFHVNKVTSKNW